jgi:hypothetical protein
MSCGSNCNFVPRLLFEAITFTRSGVFMNPSRASPHVVKTNPVSESARSVEYASQAGSYGFNPYIVFTSVLLVTSSNLTSEPVGIFRQISGLMCTQEWERFCAFFCMVFKVPELRAQIFEGSVVISTRAKQKDRDDGKYQSHHIAFEIL